MSEHGYHGLNGYFLKAAFLKRNAAFVFISLDDVGVIGHKKATHLFRKHGGFHRKYCIPRRGLKKVQSVKCVLQQRKLYLHFGANAMSAGDGEGAVVFLQQLTA